MKYLFLILLFAGCSKTFSIVKYERPSGSYYSCREGYDDIMICNEVKDCNDFCEKKRSAK